MVARVKAVVKEPEIEAAGVVVPDIPVDDFVMVDEIAELIDGLGDVDGYDISVNALVGRKLEWLFDYTPDQMTVKDLRAHLRDEHGGGEFKVVVRRNGVFVSHKTIAIRAKKPSNFGQSSGAVVQPVDRLAEVMALMSQQIAQSQSNMQTQIMENQKESMRQQMEMMRMMIEKGSGGGQQLDVVSILSIAKDLFKGRDNSVELLLRGIDLAKELNPEKEGESSSSGLAKVLETFGAPLAALVTAHQAKQNSVVSSVEQLPGENNESQMADEEQMNLMRQVQIKAAAGMFIKAAEQGRDVGSYAEIFCDQYGDQVPDEFLTDVDEFNKIFDFVPEAVPHKEWFEALRVACVKILFEEGEE